MLGYGRADGGTPADFAADDGGGGNPTARAATSSPAKTLDLSGDKREGAQMPPFAFAALAAANGKPDKNAEADPVLANARRLLAAANGASGVTAERAPSGGAGLALAEHAAAAGHHRCGPRHCTSSLLWPRGGEGEGAARGSPHNFRSDPGSVQKVSTTSKIRGGAEANPFLLYVYRWSNGSRRAICFES